MRSDPKTPPKSNSIHAIGNGWPADVFVGERRRVATGLRVFAPRGVRCKTRMVCNDNDVSMSRNRLSTFYDGQRVTRILNCCSQNEGKMV